jgi:hypothetical protein
LTECNGLIFFLLPLVNLFHRISVILLYFFNILLVIRLFAHLKQIFELLCDWAESLPCLLGCGT